MPMDSDHAGWIRTLLTLNALIGLAVGVVLLLVPAAMMSVLGQSTDGTGTAYARLYGAELLGLNVATWFARNGSADVWRPVIYGHVVNESLTALVIAATALGGLGNLLLWGLVLVSGAFAVAFVLAALTVRGPMRSR